ncbi:biotin carboxyl carrier protein of acetyl-CoA carboxylase 2, chloroplastic-like isoform X2 [Diospyros lotus]|uniref:biotin carboxyl carrier protein of acetyl-CoA carboxylase 2, chloroplastic-like isoform X2 n=1 Tax=Diospyros lotus TaxID=55363 RepID=UPI00224E5F2F|nr:biotin carboxyl carrier protein of acetyl-CoA carboxylase 2, chloroplastic-like isoform X2 [Diospyros lotus]
MASFSVPCPKTSAPFTASRPSSKRPEHCSVSFLSSSPALFAGGRSSLSFQGSGHNQSDGFKVFSQLNEIDSEKLSNSVPVPKTKEEEAAEKYASQNNIPDASAISAFMTQAADLIELVDSRDIMELQLKQLGCELIIRKKEALQQQVAPSVIMQPPYPQATVPSQLPVPVNVPAPAGSVPSPPASPPAPPSPVKPKSSHPPLKCPMAGTLYRSPAPGAPPFVKVGDKVQKGQVVCIIEAMKLMNEIEADQSGTVVEAFVDDGKPVSVDTPLFIIEP